MKRTFIALIILSALTGLNSCEPAKEILGTIGTNSGAVTEQEAGMGIKEALSNGLANAVLNLNKTDGFFGSDIYKVLLPPDAVKAEQRLRSLGLGKEVDKAVLSINRAAEDAVGFAKPIFVNAIKSMSLQDALGIVKGGKNSATNFFKEKTSAALIEAFAPSVKSSLEKVSATKYYGDLATTYNSIPLVQNKINPDLTNFVVGKSVDALFDQIAKEEVNIRENPLARTSDILKKVFGSVIK
jgi:hypothetical protein